MKKVFKIALIVIVFISTKAFSQDSLKTKSYAIVEIAKNRYYGSEFTTLLYGDGKIEDLTDKLYNNNGKRMRDTSIDRFIDDTYADNKTANNNLSIAQKALLCIKYMAEKNYILVSSTAATGGQNNCVMCIYSYQYIFEKRDK
ncbi:MAG: hypothetical protein ACYDCN_07020 [Bacteroidia bacterium]